MWHRINRHIAWDHKQSIIPTQAEVVMVKSKKGISFPSDVVKEILKNPFPKASLQEIGKELINFLEDGD